jgi:hypothetical protein
MDDDRIPAAWPRMARRPVAGTLGLAIALSAASLLCLPRTARAQAPAAPAVASPLAPVEDAYQVATYWDDQLRLARALGSDSTPDGVAVAIVQDSLQLYATRFRQLLGEYPPASLSAEDRRARAVLRDAAEDGLGALGAPAASATPSRMLAALTDSIFAAYGRAANRIIFERDTLNRLAVLGRLAHTDSPAERRRLFLSLAPVWQSVNGDGEGTSPYRSLLRLRRAEWGDTASPIERKGPAFGLSTAELEQWLTSALERWRVATPDSLIEPWDWYYFTGAASRRLSRRIPAIGDIQRVNNAYYEAIGASPMTLRIRYDLGARPGKYPVAYTDFGSRNRWIGDRLVSGEPVVFTSYLGGGLDNLAELLHESGHAIHIAAIRTRPAYIDWPDNDTFTEALADLPALELYEPAWQLRFLGDSASLAESLRAKYASIVFDLAWALFEIRVHRTPEADPNRVWSDITSHYLHIRPHHEWSWWAMRGQLIDGPGYLVNYALGAFLVADLRASVAGRWGAFARADSLMYPHLSEAIYRFGLERPSRQVLEDFLGRPARPDALLVDLARMSR